MAAGHPPIYHDADEMKAKIEAYFEVQGEKVTITGMAYQLGFESRQSIYDYKERGEFSYIIKRACLFIESVYETKLSGNNAAGPIFFLKNMGWFDKQQTEISGSLNTSGVDLSKLSPEALKELRDAQNTLP